MRRPLLLAIVVALGAGSPALAQHSGHQMPAPAAEPAPGQACLPEHAAMGHCTRPPVREPQETAPASATPPASPADPHAGHATLGSTPPVAPPPPEALSGPEHAADAVWGSEGMTRARTERLVPEHGGYTGFMVLVDRLEYRAAEGRDGYAWDAEAWYGDDRDRLWIKSEGGGEFGAGLEAAEVQALYSRAISPWFNLQSGMRYDIGQAPDRAHLVLGVQGLAPYWFELDGALFLSDQGELTARIEGEYDQRITNRLILQPRLEADLAAQNVRELGTGAGLSSVEAGLRLRYEIEREFAPYVGVEYERRLGRSADFTRAADEDVGGWAVLIGLRS